jgi:hypothetical protein
MEYILDLQIGNRHPGLTEVAACAHGMRVNIIIEKFDSQVFFTPFGQMSTLDTIFVAAYKLQT